MPLATWTLLGFLAVLGQFQQVTAAGNTCCDKSRFGFVEFQELIDFMHDPTTIEAHFSYNNVTDIYSIDRKAVLEFNKNHYFWDDHYEPLDNRTKVCSFKLSKDPGVMEHVVFSDGSRPTQVVFGCHSNQECCEVGCCEIYKYFYFWFIYPACIVLLIFAHLARKRREHEAREERLRRIFRGLNVNP